MTAYRITCRTCGWYARAADFGYVDRAGFVHVRHLKPGHELASLGPVPDGDWLR